MQSVVATFSLVIPASAQNSDTMHTIMNGFTNTVFLSMHFI